MGKYEIKGDEVFAILQSYDTKEEADCKLEAHKKYVAKDNFAQVVRQEKK